MTTSAIAQIERPYRQGPPYYGTTADIAEGLLHVQNEILPEPGPTWRAALEDHGDMLLTDAEPNGVSMFFRVEEELIGTASLFILDALLDQMYLPHEIALRPAQVDWRAASITNSLPTAAISAGDAESLRDYVIVDTRELTGSALYVIFHTLRTAGTQAVRHVQFGRCEPIPIHT